MLEPCVGEGAISEYLLDCGLRVLTNDINKERKADYHHDARKSRIYEIAKDQGIDWSVTNYPFDDIDTMIRTALTEMTNVITLARLSVLEPTKARREIYRHYQPDMCIVLPRYCFRLNDKGKRATDSVTCAWVGWGPEVPRITTVWTEPPPEEKGKQK